MNFTRLQIEDATLLAALDDWLVDLNISAFKRGKVNKDQDISTERLEELRAIGEPVPMAADKHLCALNMHYRPYLQEQIIKYLAKLEPGNYEPTAALCYYPTGFMGWHTNEDFPGHRYYFVWSEDGRSGMKYYDSDEGLVFGSKDWEGWNLRKFEVGEDCWHCVWADCVRVALGFKQKE